MALVLGIDLGGTFIKSAVMKVDGDDVEFKTQITRIETIIASESALLEQLSDIVNGYKKDFAIAAVGVVSPGIINDAAGIVHFAANLPFKETNVVRHILTTCALPAALNHDGRATTIAEQRLGAGRGYSDFVFMPIGTGISVGLVIDGEVRNSRGKIGEIGHANVGHDLACGCGLSGCFEVIASTAGIARNYKERTGTTKTSEEIVAAIKTDSDAMAVWNQAVDAITLTCDWLMNSLSPQAFVFGGGLAGAGDILINAVQQKLSQRISFQEIPELKIAQLSSDAGCIGAALLAAKAVAA